MYRNGTWGGNIEIQAASMLYQLNITVHQLNQPRWEIVNFPGTTLPFSCCFFSIFPSLFSLLYFPFLSLLLFVGMISEGEI
jgi:hypothetical protein